MSKKDKTLDHGVMASASKPSKFVLRVRLCPTLNISSQTRSTPI